MGPYEVRFDCNDVFNWFSRLYDLELGERKDALVSINHGLRSGFPAVNQEFILFSEELPGYGTMPASEQRDLVKKMISKGVEIDTSIKSIDLFCKEGIEAKLDLRKACGEFVEKVKQLSHYLPFANYVPKMAPLAEKRQTALELIDFYYTTIFYFYNNLFSQKDKDNNGRFYLNMDLGGFNVSLSMEGNKSLRAGPCDILSLETKIDYFTNAVMPLIINIIDHAGNPDNDIKGRLKDPDRLPGIYFDVSDEVDEVNKVITIKVRDSGFGIKPEIEERLFQKGTSTKDSEGHGIGLWGVKKFVESAGGKIWCETELGKGTSFYFTIPYTKKVQFTYVQ